MNFQVYTKTISLDNHTRIVAECKYSEYLMPDGAIDEVEDILGVTLYQNYSTSRLQVNTLAPWLMGMIIDARPDLKFS